MQYDTDFNSRQQRGFYPWCTLRTDTSAVNVSSARLLPSLSTEGKLYRNTVWNCIREILVSELKNFNCNLRWSIAYLPLTSVMLRKWLQSAYVQVPSLQHLINKSYSIHSCGQRQFEPYSDYIKCAKYMEAPLAFHIQHPKLMSISLSLSCQTSASSLQSSKSRHHQQGK